MPALTYKSGHPTKNKRWRCHDFKGRFAPWRRFASWLDNVEAEHEYDGAAEEEVDASQPDASIVYKHAADEGVEDQMCETHRVGCEENQKFVAAEEEGDWWQICGNVPVNREPLSIKL